MKEEASPWLWPIARLARLPLLARRPAIRELTWPQRGLGQVGLQSNGSESNQRQVGRKGRLAPARSSLAAPLPLTTTHLFMSSRCG